LSSFHFPELLQCTDKAVRLGEGRIHVLEQRGNLQLDVDPLALEGRNCGGVQVVFQIKNLIMESVNTGAMRCSARLSEVCSSS